MKRKIIWTAIFFVYLIVLFYLLLLEDRSVLLGAGGEKIYSYNLIPFREIYRFLTNADVVGLKASLYNILGNIGIFIPLGILFPYVNHRKDRWISIIVYGFFISFLIESIQLILAIGSFDVDDLILNTLGAMIGYMFYRIWMKRWKGK